MEFYWGGALQGYGADEHYGIILGQYTLERCNLEV